MTKTHYATTREIIDGRESPLPIATIPNNMGINLNSVRGVSWTKRDDGQLVDLTIHFIPAD